MFPMDTTLLSRIHVYKRLLWSGIAQRRGKARTLAKITVGTSLECPGNGITRARCPCIADRLRTSDGVFWPESIRREAPLEGKQAASGRTYSGRRKHRPALC